MASAAGVAGLLLAASAWGGSALRLLPEPPSLPLSAAAPAPPLRTPRAALHPKDGPDVDLSLLVESRGARLLVRANGVAVQALATLPGSSPQGLEVAWAEDLAASCLQILQPGLRLRFDGEAADWSLGRVRIEPGDPARADLFPIHGALAASVLELELLTAREPSATELELRWEGFGLEATELPFLPLVVLAGAQRTKGELSPEAPSLRWTLPEDTAPSLRPLPEPPPRAAPRGPWLLGLGALGLAWIGWLWLRGRRGTAALAGGAGLILGIAGARSAAPELTDEEAQGIFSALHHNLYAAFDSVDRDQIYDALASGVSGELLDGVYGDVLASLLVADHGGSRGRVEALETQAARIESRDRTGAGRARFRVHAEWRVHALVEHSDHAHRRAEEYAARYTVLATDAGWRIVQQELLRQERLPAPAPSPVR